MAGAPNRAAWTPERIDRAFRLVEAAAVKSERCPQTTPFGPLESCAFEKLIALRLVDSEIYFKNYRVAVLLVGPHAGKRTLLPKGAIKPWKINGRHVSEIGGRTFRADDVPAKRQQPSAPRLLTDPRNSDAPQPRGRTASG
jgi:hypothetical protein